MYEYRTLNGVKRLFIAPLVALIALLTLVGCTEGERGIFATIAIEEEIKKNNLVDNASISGLVKTDIGGTEWYVAVAGTKVFVRSVTGNDWKEISGPGSRLAQFIAGIDSTGAPGGDQRGTVEDVYVVYQGASSQESAVYRLTDGLGWELAYAPSGTFVDGLVGIDEILLASTGDNNLLVWSSGASSITGIAPTSTIAGFNDGIRDGVRYDNDGNGVFTNSGTDYLYLLGKSGFLVELAGTTLTQFVPIGSSPQPRGIGVAPYDTSILVVTDADGSVYVTSSNTPTSGTSGTSDIVAESGGWNSAGTVGRPAADIVWVDVINNGNGAFLVATNSDAVRSETGRGYYEATISGSSGSYALSFNNDLGNNYEASDLAIASINGLRHFGNGVVFALTGGLGLWTTVYPPAGGPTWDWE